MLKITPKIPKARCIEIKNAVKNFSKTEMPQLNPLAKSRFADYTTLGLVGTGIGFLVSGAAALAAVGPLLIAAGVTITGGTSLLETFEALRGKENFTKWVKTQNFENTEDIYAAKKFLNLRLGILKSKAVQIFCPKKVLKLVA